MANSKRTSLEMKSGLSCKRPATNSLTYGTPNSG